MRKTKKPKIKATRTQLLRMRRDVLIRMAATAFAFVLIVAFAIWFVSSVFFENLWNLSPINFLVGSLGGLLYAILFLMPALLPLFYFLWHLLPKYRRIEAALSPEDYRKWMQLSKTATYKLPKEDIQTAHRIYKEYRLRLPDCTEELTLLLKSELKRDWYRRLTIAMLCGLLMGCPDFTDTALLCRAMTERKQAGQLVFPVWLDCLEGRTERDRDRIARDFLIYWDRKLFPRR